jgi:ATP-dependent RNA helicase DDX24/MAK5
MKRPHNTPSALKATHKRQKLEAPPRPFTDIPKRKVRLHDLGWKQVTMPDRLEDFEGFYGLEEIDDVAIVRDAKTGNITFETTKTEEQVAEDVELAWQREEMEAKQLEKISFGKQPMDENVFGEDGGQDAGEEDSWEGFSDEENVEETPAVAAKKAPATNGETKAEKKKSSMKRQKDPKSKDKNVKDAKQDDPPTNGGSLEDADEDEIDEEVEEEEENDEGDNDEDISETGTVGQSAFGLLADLPEDDDEVDVSAWEDLELSTEVLESLARLKFSKPTIIQASTIPEIMAGRDVIGKASTGSGKTLAFGIPIVEAYLANKAAVKVDEERSPLALIVAPTRELAHQITAHLTALCSKGEFEAPHIASVTGGLAVQKQRRQLEKADIVVGTPGRLWEVISTGQGLLEKFQKIRFLVIDEADRLLSHGNYKELEEILKVLQKDDVVEGDAEDSASDHGRQTLVFSATFQKSLQQKLAGKSSGSGDILNKQQSMDYLLKKLKFREEKPKFIDANPTSQMASRLKEGLIECAGTDKDLYLYSLLMFYPKKRALIFTNSISAVRRLTPFLVNLALPAVPLHSSMIQKARLRSIERFKQRPGSILVATDVAARGLDIPNVDLVIHYHLPRAADTYVHRSGRTARAEAPGSSILICAPEEVGGVRRLIAKVHARAGSAPKSKKTAYFIRTLDIDRRIVSRLKARATISKKLADTVIAKEKKHSEDDLLRQGAEDLGIDYDSEEFEKEARGKHGRGNGRMKKEKISREMTKGEQQALRAELRGLLSERINTGVSAKYLTNGGIDVEALMAGEGNMEFLGNVDGLGFDD